MAFNKKEWTDRIAEYINRRLLTKEDGSTELVTVAREEGNVSQEGDAFNANNMNDLEQRISDEFVQVNKSLDGKQDKLTNPLTKSDVVNNLTSSATNVPLSANQGKVLNDKLTDLVTLENYTYDSVSIAAGTAPVVTPKSNTIPSGYSPISISDVNSGNTSVMIRSINKSGTLGLRNVGSSSVTVTPTVSVLCIKSSFVK
ncbi:MAG: hypothetical protein PUB19_10305 [Lachnospiraceae bacterium]|nr:hypothetical protein [Lachnospiraceae bacterium]